MDWDEVFAIGTLVVVLVIVVGLAVYIPVSAGTDRRCLAAGYPKGSVTYALERYCVRRVDQTDIVVPLAKAERGTP